MKRYIKSSTIITTFEQLAKVVADGFIECMQEGGSSGEPFESFEDMRMCYRWTTNEIKDIIDEILCSIPEVTAYIDDDRTSVFLNGDFISYRKFWNMCKKKLNYSSDNETDRDYDTFFS